MKRFNYRALLNKQFWFVLIDLSGLRTPSMAVCPRPRVFPESTHTIAASAVLTVHVKRSKLRRSRIGYQLALSMKANIPVSSPLTGILHPRNTLMMIRFIFMRTADNLWVQEGGWLVPRVSSSLRLTPTPTPSNFCLSNHCKRKNEMKWELSI